MRGLHKSKRVSWASDVNLCQVRLFLSEESPSQVGLGAQDHLEAKTSWLLHSNGTVSDDILPPGFEGTHPANQFQIKLFEIPVINWSRPPRFELNYIWQVVSGEESKEFEVQSQREMRVLEAVYPRPSAIPLNPTVLVDSEDSHHNNGQTPLIPITAVEDEDTGLGADISTDSVASFNITTSSQPQVMAPGIPPPSQSSTPSIPKPLVLGVESDVVAAASAALTAITKSNEPGKSIDQDLLVKFLSDPKLTEKLLSVQGTAANSQSIPNLMLPLVASSNPPSLLFNRTDTGASSQASASSGPFYPPPNGVGVAPLPYTHRPPPAIVPVSSQPSFGAPPAQNFNYYKNLIQQHGGERQENPLQYGSHHSQPLGANLEPVNNSKSRDSKPKIMKPCIYFNSSRGCRHGANCAYQHDTSFKQRGGSSSMPEVQSSKRTKMDSEIRGT